MSETEDRWRRVDEIFQAALDLPAGRREDFVLHEAGDDRDLRVRVERLLRLADTDDALFAPGAGGEGAGGLLDPPMQDGLPTVSAPRSVPETIGPYRILGRLGEGGFGEVFHAEQTEPVRRHVALKILKAGMDSRAVLTRFAAERQALALMDHPDIAKFYDAGETEAGYPFFAMEYVAGEPLTDYCDRLQLGLRERCSLFVLLCRAIQHAHAKGVIHRDLKPSNVLVAAVDGAPHPKVIDFGIAKAVAMPLTDATLHTMPGQVIGTPAYMAPERLEPGGDADTRSDIWSLGVLLYELLAGELPFRDTAEVGLQETLRRIRSGDLAAPSTRIVKTTPPTVAAARGTDTANLRRQVRGDLDWITLRAMAREPERRYQSANALAEDIERYLRGEAVEAGPESATYRFSKFARRHKVIFAATAAVFLGVIVAAAALAWALAESNRQRDAVEAALADAQEAREASDAVTGFLTDMMISVRPGEQGRDVTVREVLDGAALDIGTEMADRPAVESRVRRAIGSSYRALGELDAAEEHLTRAVAMMRELHGEDHRETLAARYSLANVVMDQGRLGEAEIQFARLLEDERRVLGERSEEAIETLNSLASVHTLQGHWAIADSLEVLSLEASREVLGPEHPRTLAVVTNLGTLRRISGQTASAESLLVFAVESHARAGRARHPDALSAQASLATVYYVQGRYQEAADLLESVIEVRLEVLGPEHPDTLIAMGDLAVMLSSMGRVDEAIVINEEALVHRRAVLGNEHPNTLQTMNNLAIVYGKAERYDDAEELLTESLAIKRRTLGPEHIDTLTTQGNLADLLSRTGREEEGLPLLEDAAEKAARTLPDTHYRRTLITQQWGSCLARLGRREEAEPKLLEAYERFVEALGEDHARVRRVVEVIAAFYEEGGRADEAAAWRAKLPPGSEG